MQAQNVTTGGPAGTLLGQQVARQAARYWWLPLVAAVAWFLVAWLVLRGDYTSLTTVGVLVGVVFLLAAVNEGAMAGVMGGGWAVLHIALSVFFVLGALWAFIQPIESVFALASVLGLLLFLQGILTLARGVAMRDESPHWWLEVVSGGLLILLALWVSSSRGVWTLGTRVAFILLWVGFMAIFRGISDIVLAFSLHRIGKAAAAATAAGPGTAPPIPSQERREAVPGTAAAERTSPG
jgi:uncharacterized membrane protein HdeD (DUF308 family)